MLSVAVWPGTNIPLELGEKFTSDKSLLAVQLRSPWELEDSVSGSLHVQLPSLFGEQFELLKLLVPITRVGVGQLHGTLTELPPDTRKVRLVCAGQTVSGMKAATFTV